MPEGGREVARTPGRGNSTESADGPVCEERIGHPRETVNQVIAGGPFRFSTSRGELSPSGQKGDRPSRLTTPSHTRCCHDRRLSVEAPPFDWNGVFSLTDSLLWFGRRLPGLP